MNEDERAWREAKESYQPVSTGNAVQRQRGMALLVAFAAAFLVIVAFMALAVAFDLTHVSYAGAALALAVFWGVRRALRPKTIFEDEPKPPT